MLMFTSNFPNHTLGKSTGLLPFELFTHVKEGHLHPLDKNGKPILSPDIKDKIRRLEGLQTELENLPLAYGALQTGFVMTPRRSFSYNDKEVEKQKLDMRKKSLLKEHEILKQELDAIEDKYSWANYELPINPIQRQQVFDLLCNAIYLIKDVVAVRASMGGNILTGCELETDKVNISSEIKDEESAQKRQPEMRTIQSHPTPQEQPARLEEKATEAKPSINNFFVRGEYKHWRVGFDSKKCTLNHLDGISYIAALLEKPGTSISDRDLYQVTSGAAPDNTISEGAAIEQGLSIGNSKQGINDHDAKKIYLKKYNELQGNLENVESDLERQEIEKEMNAILQCLNKQNFVDPNAKKTQANITKRLNAAYDSIHYSGMKELAKHLRDNIKTDGAYGRIYSGSINWEILIR